MPNVNIDNVVIDKDEGIPGPYDSKVIYEEGTNKHVRIIIQMMTIYIIYKLKSNL